MDRLRIAIVGSEGSGKTSIFNRLVYDKFINVSFKDVGKIMIDLDNKQVDVTFVDYSNFDPYGTVNLSNKRGIHGYIIICDLSNDFHHNNFENVFSYVADFNDKAEMCIFFNKSDVRVIDADQINEKISDYNKEFNSNIKCVIGSTKNESSSELLYKFEPFLIDIYNKEKNNNQGNVIKSKSLGNVIVDSNIKKKKLHKTKSCNIQ